MEFRVRLSSECEDQTSLSPNFNPKNNRLHIWNPASLSLDGYTLGYNNLILEFLLYAPHGTLLVKRVLVPTNKVIHYPTQPKRKSSIRTKSTLYESFSDIGTMNHSLRIDNCVEFSYTAHLYRDLTDGVTPLGLIYIDSIVMEFDLGQLTEFQGHRITCMINDKYLGRAQECITCDTARYMAWKPVEDSAGWPMSPRGSEHFELLRREGEELKWIRRADPAGVGEKTLRLDTIYDNDGFSNPIRRLPDQITSNDLPLRIQIFNFKFNPPRSAETTIKWKDFENSTSLLFATPRKHHTPRKWFGKSKPVEPTKTSGLIEKRLLHDLTLRVSYTLDKNVATIDFIKLHIAQYETTLDMDEMQEAKTF